MMGFKPIKKIGHFIQRRLWYQIYHIVAYHKFSLLCKVTEVAFCFVSLKKGVRIISLKNNPNFLPFQFSY